MSRLAPTGHVRVPVSPSSDVTSYNLYYRMVGAPTPTDPPTDPPTPDDGGLNYLDAHLSNLHPIDDGQGGQVLDVDLASITGLVVDGSLRVGASAIDDVGNESDIGATAEVPFDDLAPEAPGTPVYVPPAG